MKLPSRGRELLKSAVIRVGGPRMHGQAVRLRTAWELAQARRFILLNSHMRSYSSLLSHVLSSTSEVCGYAEMRRSYRAEADLMALAWQVRSTNGARLTGPVVLDKLLHRSHFIADDVLEMSNVSIIVSVREPLSTVKSIVAMGNGIDPQHHWANPAHACHHYVDRLESLVELVQRSYRPIILDPDALMMRTHGVLLELQEALDLRLPLKETYPVRELTGEAEYGDTSDHISTGQIVRDRPHHDEVELSREIVERVSVAAESFWDQMPEFDATIIRP